MKGKWKVVFHQDFNGYSEFEFETYPECLIPGQAYRPCDKGIRNATTGEHVELDLPEDATWNDIPAMLAAWYPDADVIS